MIHQVRSIASGELLFEERGICAFCGERREECPGIGMGCRECARQRVEAWLASRTSPAPAPERSRRSQSAPATKRNARIDDDALVAQPSLIH